MKTQFKIFFLFLMTALWACEKNDPLEEQGELTGDVVAFNLLAQMPDAAPGDTLNLRNVSWAIDDNIETITFSHEGFKLRTFEVKIAFNLEDTLYERQALLTEDSVITSPTLFASYPEEGEDLNDYYQTQDNAYVILHDFIVPQQYALSKESNEELILAMDDSVFNWFVQTFSATLNRDILLFIFPDLNAFSTTLFEIDDMGNFTGELTPEGMQYYIDNTDRELFNAFLTEAVVSDNTRVTLETEAILEGMEEGATSQRTFRVL